MNRGARREPIFLDDNHCTEFLKLLAQLPERFGLRVHGFALMPNHFHLMLESQRGELSRGVAFLQARYGLLLNRHHGWDGPLFRARFRNRIVDRPEYWRHLLAYLHLNPLRAHLVMSLAQTRWTSHSAYVQPAPHLAWVTTDELLGLYGGREGYTSYIRRCRNRRVLAPDEFARHSLFGQGRIRDKPQPPIKVEETTVTPGCIDEELARAAHLLHAELPELLTVQSGRAADPRRLATIWWLVQRRGIRVKDLALTLGVSPARISQIVRRVQQRGSEAPVCAVVERLSRGAKY